MHRGGRLVPSLLFRRPSPTVTLSLLLPAFDARVLTDFLELMPDWRLLNLDSRRFVNLAELEDQPIIGLHDLLVAKPAQQSDTLEVMRQRSELHVEERLSEEDWRNWRPRWNDWFKGTAPPPWSVPSPRNTRPLVRT